MNKRILLKLGTILSLPIFLSYPVLGRGLAIRKAASDHSAPVAVVAKVKVNRTIPKVQPPSSTLQFSANPTAQDIFRARVFEEPLVPIGKPSAGDNSALAAALLAYSKRSGPDDFASLTGFLEKHPKSPWRAALLTNLGIEYYNTAHFSLTIPAWSEAWRLSKDTTESKGKAIADRAVGELAYMFARLGRMAELDDLLKSVDGRVFTGPGNERISGAREGLWTMQNDPGVAFRCGPLALYRIKLLLDPKNADTDLIHASASTQDGFSLPQVIDLSQKLGLDYQMAFRDKGAAIVVPSVIHWKVGHYAAIIRKDGNRYLLQDPTFRNDIWITQEALQSEASGYFAIRSGSLPPGWRTVEAEEGGSVWGKGVVGGPGAGDGGGGCGGCCGGPPPGSGFPPGSGPPPGDGPPAGNDPPPPGRGMAIPSVDLLFVSLGLSDEPVGYSPPVGPSVRFRIHYNQRDAFQPANFTYSNFGAKWTFDWLSYIKDDPSTPGSAVQYYRMGGFIRNFTGFNGATQSYAVQLLDLTKLTRTSSTSYEMVSADGSKLIFSQPDGANGTSRKIFLKQIIDSAGNVVTLTYDGDLRIVAVADAIGQVTTIAYQHPTDFYKITKVTDPFGRVATFDYDGSSRLTKVTDVIGLTSEFVYEGSSDFISSLITPYGTTAFTKGGSGTTRSLETLYPDGERERVEFNQDPNLGIPDSDPPASVPVGMATENEHLYPRNTFFWSKIACATAYRDYTKAKIYHWLHTADFSSAARILESQKSPLEGRIWYDYAGQPRPIAVGSSSKPAHSGRVLDDGNTQLYSHEYNDFGNVTKTIDPVGRTFSYIYAANGQDLLETRMTRNGANELLSQVTYNAQHRPLTTKDAAGQTTTYGYNARGQTLSVTNAKNETTTFDYDSAGYLISIDGPLAGTSDRYAFTYDGFGRTRTTTGLDGYTLTFDYDPADRVTKVTYPDATFIQNTYDRLDVAASSDRLGRSTLFEHDSQRRLIRQEDPLSRVTRFEWCPCGALAQIIDPLNRVTGFHHDVESRVISKEYADGSKIQYTYERNTSRVSQKVDEKGRFTVYKYNLDDTLQQVSYPDAPIATPSVAYTYDSSYERVASMVDGIGTTSYVYHPIIASPTLGAGRLASVDGPLDNDTVTYEHDELGRLVSRSVDGATSTTTFDALGRQVSATNSLGVFSYIYDGATRQVASITYPNGQSSNYTYFGNSGEHRLQQLSHVRGSTPISQFTYTYNSVGNILSWSQRTEAEPAKTYSFGYDALDQLTSALLVQGGTTLKSYAYTYDLAGNRTEEQIDGFTKQSSFNSLNELTTTSNQFAAPATYEWDSVNRLTAIVQASDRTEFSYDGYDRCVRIVEKQSGATIGDRRILWCGPVRCEERNGSGETVRKRYFNEGMQLVGGSESGVSFYTRDHLGSIREMIDSNGGLLARYDYDPFGRQTKLQGLSQSDFGYAFLASESRSGLAIAVHRFYDPERGRWINRDPIGEDGGLNLYRYAANNPVNLIDPKGWDPVKADQQCKKVPDIDAVRAQANRAITHKDTLDCVLKNLKNVRLKCNSEALGKCKAKGHEGTLAACDPGGTLQNPIEIIWWCNPDESDHCLQLALVHELAHSCGWDHTPDAGVPFDNGEPGYPCKK